MNCLGDFLHSWHLRKAGLEAIIGGFLIFGLNYIGLNLQFIIMFEFELMVFLEANI